VGKKAERWVWRPFTSSARTDNSAFYHWTKLRDPVEDYKFSKLNKHVPILEYDDAEYDEHLVSNDWTRGETDHLLQMCRRFDCRFIIIQDQWDMTPARSVEDLKERYYFIQRKLIEIVGIKSNDSYWKKHPLVKDPFNKDQERDRKIQLECLFRRDKRQIQEEDEITPKANVILETFKRRKKEGQKLIALAQKIGQTNASESRRGGRGRGRGRGRASSTASGTAAMNIKNPRYRAQINQTLQSFGISKPDKNSKCSVQYNNLKNALVILFDLEKIQNEATYELQVLKEQRKLLLQDKQRRSGQMFSEDDYQDQHEEHEPEHDHDHEAELETENNELDVDGGEVDSEVSTEGDEETRQGEGDADGDGDDDDEYVE